MADYDFKVWLTVEEAAAWLADNGPEGYSAPALYRAIEKRLIQAYYWPDVKANLGIFGRLEGAGLKPMRALIGRGSGRDMTFVEGRNIHFVGPVPFTDYPEFKLDAESPSAEPVGIRSPVDQNGDTIRGGIYILGQNEAALSLTSIRYKVLIHIRELEGFAYSPTTTEIPCPSIFINESSPLPLAYCIPPGADDFPHQALNDAYIDQPIISSQTQDAGRRPDLKTLAFAAHLLANLAERLDESEPVASRKLGMKKAGKPVVSQIAAQLAKTAEALNYSGHGYGEKGFQAHLSRALKELD